MQHDMDGRFEGGKVFFFCFFFFVFLLYIPANKFSVMSGCEPVRSRKYSVLLKDTTQYSRTCVKLPLKKRQNNDLNHKW